MLACKSRSAVGVFGGVVGSRNKLRQCPCKDTSWHEEDRRKEKEKQDTESNVLISNEAANRETTPAHATHQTTTHEAACKRLAPRTIVLIATLI